MHEKIYKYTAYDGESLAGSGTWLEGKRFGGSESEDEMKAWINGLGIE